jgi:hypothetical protein
MGFNETTRIDPFPLRCGGWFTAKLKPVGDAITLEIMKLCCEAYHCFLPLNWQVDFDMIRWAKCHVAYNLYIYDFVGSRPI